MDARERSQDIERDDTIARRRAVWGRRASEGALWVVAVTTGTAGAGGFGVALWELAGGDAGMASAASFVGRGLIDVACRVRRTAARRRGLRTVVGEVPHTARRFDNMG